MQIPTARLMTLTMMAGLAGGCGGPQLGSDARVPIRERHVIRAGSTAGQSLRLPADRGFNIHVKQSSQNLGAAGDAQGRSDATPHGVAFAEVTASNGGSAAAEFKIGHRIDNLSADAQSMAARISFRLKQEIRASDPPDPATLAQANLLLVVVDSRKRVVSRTAVVQASSDDSQGLASLPQDRELAVQLEPGESYDLVLFGQVEAATSETQRASARLSMDQLEMHLTFASPATQPAVRASR